MRTDCSHRQWQDRHPVQESGMHTSIQHDDQRGWQLWTWRLAEAFHQGMPCACLQRQQEDQGTRHLLVASACLSAAACSRRGCTQPAQPGSYWYSVLQGKDIAMC